jgi:hypothetical protein
VIPEKLKRGEEVQERVSRATLIKGRWLSHKNTVEEGHRRRG